MSNLIGAANPQNIIQKRLGGLTYAERNSGLRISWSFVAPRAYWMRSRINGGDPAVRGVWQHPPLVTAGSKYLFGIVGKVRDVNGTAVSGAVVKLFRTSDDVLVNQGTTDLNGDYTVHTPYYGESHYLVTYKTGTPDIFGTSPNTLLPQ